MSARRILTVSFLISLMGHLIIFTTFSVATFEKRERPYEITSLSFLGEFAKEKPSFRMEGVVGKGRIPQLQPMVRELDVGPGLSLSKPRPTVPLPQIFGEGINSLLKGEEESLLEVKVSNDMKENPPKEPHLLEKEQGEK